MVIAEFIRFYHYTLEQALDLHARTFYALANTMYRLVAQEELNTINSVAAGTNGNMEIVDLYVKQAKGKSGILKEISFIKDKV